MCISKIGNGGAKVTLPRKNSELIVQNRERQLMEP